MEQLVVEIREHQPLGGIKWTMNLLWGFVKSQIIQISKPQNIQVLLARQIARLIMMAINLTLQSNPIIIQEKDKKRVLSTNFFEVMKFILNVKILQSNCPWNKYWISFLIRLCYWGTKKESKKSWSLNSHIISSKTLASSMHGMFQSVRIFQFPILCMLSFWLSKGLDLSVLGFGHI